MVSVIFAILKFIGLLFLGILLFMLLVLLLVMLSPLKYKVIGKGDKEEDISGEAKVSWLLGIIKVTGRYIQGQDAVIDIKLFGISITNRKKKPKKNKKKESKKKELKGNKKTKETKETKETKSPPVQEMPQEQVLNVRENTSMLPSDMARKKTTLVPKIESTPMKMPEQKMGARRVKIESIKEQPIEKKTLDSDETIGVRESVSSKSTTDKSGATKAKIGLVNAYWRKFQGVEDKKVIIQALKKSFKRMIAGILPENLKIKAKIGLTEPFLTGQFMGLVGILTARFGDNVKIIPDFTQTTMEDIEVEVKGKIVFGYFVYIMMAFALAKPVKRQLWKLWKGRKRHE